MREAREIWDHVVCYEKSPNKIQNLLISGKNVRLFFGHKFSDHRSHLMLWEDSLPIVSVASGRIIASHFLRCSSRFSCPHCGDRAALSHLFPLGSQLFDRRRHRLPADVLSLETSNLTEMIRSSCATFKDFQKLQSHRLQ